MNSHTGKRFNREGNGGKSSIGEEIKEFLEITTDFRPVDDLLAWWFNRRMEFPLLSRVARNILVISGSSNEVERLFSRFNSLDIVTKKGTSYLPR